MAEAKRTMIELAGASRRFGSLEAVKSFDIAVAEGEVFGLLGPDGAGKTTTLRMLAGLIDPDSGSVKVAGLEVRNNIDAVKDQIGYMAQRFGLYGDLTVEENMHFYSDLFGLPIAERDRLMVEFLDMTRMTPFRTRPAAKLSGGMKQKLALMCTLLHKPRVLFLDEPTNGVDPVSRREFWELLHEFLSGGMAILLTTPYMDEAARCHRSGMVVEGRLLEEGEPSALLAAFPHPVYRVRGDRAKITAAAATNPDVLAFTPAGAVVRVVVRRGHEDGVRASFAALGAEVSLTSASFEDLFLTRLHERTGARRDDAGNTGTRAPLDKSVS